MSCVRCGQGYQNECFIQLLGLTPGGLNEDNNFGVSILNPHASLGLYYLCGYCKIEVIPQKEALKVKTKQKNRQTPATVEN